MGRWVPSGTHQIVHASITGGGNLFQTTHTVRSADFLREPPTARTLVFTGLNGTPLVLKAGLRAQTLTKIAATACDAATGGSVDAGADAPSATDAATDSKPARCGQRARCGRKARPPVGDRAS